MRLRSDLPIHEEMLIFVGKLKRTVEYDGDKYDVERLERLSRWVGEMEARIDAEIAVLLVQQVRPAGDGIDPRFDDPTDELAQRRASRKAHSDE